MSVVEGVIYTQPTWTAACDAWKAFLTGVTGVTCTSDTGTGNSRVLLFSVPGTNKLIKFMYQSSGYGIVHVLKVDGTTILVNGIPSRIYHDRDCATAIITNGNMTCVIIKYGSSMVSYSFDMLWSKCGANTKLIIGNGIGYSYLIHATDDTYITYQFSTSGTCFFRAPSTKTLAGKQIVVPTYVNGTSALNLEDDPLEQVYSFANVESVAAGNKVLINSVMYYVLTTNVLLKTE